ncbi:MAG: DUF222 domain-containing protein [Mycobacteriales bacterium]
MTSTSGYERDRPADTAGVGTPPAPRPADVGLAAAVDDVVGADPVVLSDTDVLTCLDRLERERLRLQAAVTALVGEADSRGLAGLAGFRSTGAMLRSRLRWPTRVGNQRARTAHATTASLSPTGTAQPAAYPRLAALMTTGRLGADEVDGIISALDRIPVEEDHGVAEDLFADALADTDQVGIARLARHLSRVLDPDGAEPEDPVEPARWFDYRLGDDGSLTGRLHLDPEGAEWLRTALDPLAKPRHNIANPTGEINSDGGANGTGDGGTDDATGAGGAVEPDLGAADPRTTAQRNADGLVELARAAIRAGELPDHGGEPPQLVITIGWEQLRAGLGTVTLNDGSQLPVETVRRLACESRVIPMVLAGTGQPLDLGRAIRTVSRAQRRAVTTRDRHCAFPHCDQLAPRCDVHHIVPWIDGGPTDLDNLALLCTWHHTVIHHTDWECRMIHGRPRFIPPPWYPPGPTTHSRPRHQPLIRCRCGGVKTRPRART